MPKTWGGKEYKHKVARYQGGPRNGKEEVMKRSGFPNFYNDYSFSAFRLEGDKLVLLYLWLGEKHPKGGLPAYP